MKNNKKINKTLAGIFTFALAVTALAADFKTQNNKMVHGIKSSTADKLIEFDTNDGASNPKIKIVNSDKNWHLTTNKLKLGDAAASDKTIEADKGAGASNPKLKFNNSLSKWQFSNDGTAFSNLGAGGGAGGSGVNLLTSDDNITFDEGVTSWTASGGTKTAETSSPLFGAGSLNWDASALNQTLSSAAKSIPVGLQGMDCLGMLAYTYGGTSGDLALQVYDGTTVLSEVSLEQATSPVTAFIGFTCPTSGTVLLRLIAKVSNPSSIMIDGAKENAGQVHLGSNILLSKVANAELFGSVTITAAGTLSCEWQESGSGWESFPVDNDCNLGTATGKLQAAATKIPAFVAPSMPKGEYLVYATFPGLDASATIITWALYDGTNRKGKIVSAGSGGTRVHNIIAYFSYATDQTNLTFNIQCNSPTGAGGECQIENYNVGGADGDIEFKVIKLPSTTQTVMGSTDDMAQSWSGYHDSDCSWARTNTAYGDPAVDSTCTFTQKTNRNFGTVTSYLSGSDKLPGIVFTPKKVGNYYVCALPTLNDGGLNTNYNARLWDGTTTIAENYFAPGTTLGVIYGIPLCGIYNATSVSPTTLSIQLKSGADSLTIVGNSVAPAVQWSIFYMDSGFPMPFLTKQLQSSSDSVMKHATAKIANSGTPSVDRQDGSWLAGTFTDNGTGDITVNFSAGAFSSAPNCVCSSIGASAYICNLHSDASTSSVRILTTLNNGTATDTDFILQCTGAK